MQEASLALLLFSQVARQYQGTAHPTPRAAALVEVVASARKSSALHRLRARALLRERSTPHCSTAAALLYATATATLHFHEHAVRALVASERRWVVICKDLVRPKRRQPRALAFEIILYAVMAHLSHILEFNCPCRARPHFSAVSTYLVVYRYSRNSEELRTVVQYCMRNRPHRSAVQERVALLSGPYLVHTQQGVSAYLPKQ